MSRVSVYGADAESSRLRELKNCTQINFLLENPVVPAPCPVKLDAVKERTVTTTSESSRLLSKVVACPLYYRAPVQTSCSTEVVVYSQFFSKIGGIDKISKPVVGVSSGTYIASKIASVTGSSSKSPFTPVFFRTPPVPYICPPPKTAQDAGIPQARFTPCNPGERVIA